MTRTTLTTMIGNCASAINTRTVKKFSYAEVKGPAIYIPPLTGKPEQQRFTMQTGVLTSISSR